MAVELDHCQTIVNVHWQSAGEYVAIAVRLVSSSGTSVFDVPCGGSEDPDPGYNYYGSGYLTSITYNYERYDQAFYSNGEWSALGYGDVEVSGLRTTDTETNGGGPWNAQGEGGPTSGSGFSRFTPLEDGGSEIPVPYDLPVHNFTVGAQLTAELLCALYVGTLGCDIALGIRYKALESTPTSLFLTSDLASPIVVTYLGNVLTLVGVATDRVPATPWMHPVGGPATVNRPRVAWLLYRV